MKKNYYNYQENLVSIIMPAYNCEEFISNSIQSVKSQTYKNWELLIVDDCSTDTTAKIIKKFAVSDERIKYHKLTENSGAAVARNKAVQIAKGKYFAFLDSDDLWFEKKLEKQIYFMEKNNYTFSSTSYIKIDENGKSLNKVIRSYEKTDYNGLLKNCPGNSTIIYNAETLGKTLIPKIRKRNDYVMWLKVIKKSNYLMGIEEPLSCHRIRKGSLSKNKFSLVQYHWEIYRKYEKLNIFKSSNLIGYWVFKKILRLNN